MSETNQTKEYDGLSASGIAAELGETGTADVILVYPELDSTNRLLKQLAAEGAPDGTVVLADRQTAGRGRRGRAFYSPPGCGLYMSLLLRPAHLNADSAVRITTAASVAVCRAVERVTGLSLQIKWVNDLYLREKKVCGILVEAVNSLQNGALDGVVIGIGINVRSEGFPEELRLIAGALYEGDAPAVSRNRLAAAIIAEMCSLDAMIADRSFLPEYRARSLVLGRPVLVLDDAGNENAVAEDIDENGALLVRCEDGRLRRLSTGEISIRVREEKPVDK